MIVEVKADIPTVAQRKRVMYRTAAVARGLGRYVFWVVGRPGRWGPFDDARRATWR